MSDKRQIATRPTVFHGRSASRMGNRGIEKVLGIIERTDQNLIAAGIDRNRIDEIKRPWHKCLMRDLANPITRRVADLAEEKKRLLLNEMGALGSPVPADKLDEHASLAENRREADGVSGQMNKVIWLDAFENVPADLRRYIDEASWMSAEERQSIYADCDQEFRDVDQYAQHRTIRRREVLKL